MLAADELATAVEDIVAEVAPAGRPVPDRACSRDHRAIARRGIEAGLKLALRLLHEQAGKEVTGPN
jgi:hypothetical protein